jgi:predicted DNA-binding ribbon-helix-helix protein
MRESPRRYPRINFRCDAEFDEMLREIARERQMSTSALVRQLCQEALQSQQESPQNCR